MVIFKSDEWGPAVPYSPVDHQDGTFNHGFVDLRKRPEAIDDIPEVQGRPGLASLIKAINWSSERLMTLGCEAGVFQANFTRDNAPTVYIGSYLNIAYRDPSDGGEDNLIALARFIVQESALGREHWTQLEIGIEPMRVFFGHFGLYCLELKFLAYGTDEIMAWKVFDGATSRLAHVMGKFGTP